MKSVFTFGILFLFITIGTTQPGELVASFGNEGIIDRAYKPFSVHEIQSITVMPDQSIVTSGSVDETNINSLMSRYSKDGDLLWDVEFDASRQNIFDIAETVVAKDSSIFTTSYFDDQSFPSGNRVNVSFRKWNIDGTPDKSFGTNGEIIITSPDLNFTIFDTQIDTFGRFYLIGRTFDFGSNQEAGLVIRLNADGSMDTSYGANGIYTKRWNSARTGFISGKIIHDQLYVVGWVNQNNDLSAVFSKVDEDGQTETGFGNNGLILFSQSNVAEFWALDQQGNDHIIITGSFGNNEEDIVVRRYNLDGDLDNTFGSNGTTILDFGDDDDVKSLIVDVDNGIYLGASVDDPEDIGLIRLTPDGVLDPNFGINGITTIDVNNEDNLSAMILLEDGNIVLGGESDDGNDSKLLVIKVQGVNGCLPVSSDISMTECDSLIWNNEVLTVSGIYQQTLSTDAGCDSTINLTLTILESTSEMISAEACEQYMLNGEVFMASGTYRQTLMGRNGCDSILTIVLEIFEPTTNAINANSCGEPITINGTIYENSGSFEQVLTNDAGCDSILTIQVDIQMITALIVNQKNTLSSSSVADAYEWIDCSTNEVIAGETENEFTPAVSGEYALVVTIGQCADTSECEIVMLSTSTQKIEKLELAVAPNPTFNEFVVVNPLNADIVKMVIFNSQGSVVYDARDIGHNAKIRVDISALASGVYYLRLSDSNGRQGSQSFIKL